MNIQQLHQHYSALAKRHGLAPMQPVTLKITSHSAATEDELQSKIEQFAPVEGWICYQSRVHSFRNGEPWQVSEVGLPLSAEAIDASGNALHLRQNGQGGWTISCYSHSESAPDTAEHLCDEVTHLGNSHTGGELDYDLGYRRFWRQDEEQGVIPFAACFTGFKEKAS